MVELKLRLGKTPKIKRCNDLGEYSSRRIYIFLFNFSRRFDPFLRKFCETLNHEYAHWFLDDLKLRLSVEESICERMECN